MRHRHHRQVELRIALDDAVFVGRLIARCTPCAFRVDDQLAVVRHLALGVGHRLLQRDRALPRFTGIIRIFMMYQPKKGIHCNSRFKM